MSQFFFLLTVLLALLLVAGGAFALVTGRVSAFWVRRPVHPQWWGAGLLVMGFAVGMVRLTNLTVFMVLFLSALILQGFAFGIDGVRK
ncbi:hypothetical protein ACWCQB_07800 [Streptomyces hirsutus]|uniref:hypothetical protein n=1 Tax=Streptomyces hirsutus TaxID=35620 RepID=UPI003320A5DD